MADEEKPKPRKRAPRKQVATKPDDSQAAESPDVPEAEGGALVTTETTVATTDSGSDPGEAAAEMHLRTDELNAITFGHLTVHYPERDVEIFMDGQTAQRVLAVFSGRMTKAALQDRIVLGSSSMANVWSTFDIVRPLGITWMPGVPTPGSRRMTVDPPPAVAAA